MSALAPGQYPLTDELYGRIFVVHVREDLSQKDGVILYICDENAMLRPVPEHRHRELLERIRKQYDRRA